MTRRSAFRRGVLLCAVVALVGVPSVAQATSPVINGFDPDYKNPGGDKHLFRRLVVNHHIDEQILFEQATQVTRHDSDRSRPRRRVDEVADIRDDPAERLRKRRVPCLDPVPDVDQRQVLVVHMTLHPHG